MKDRQKIFLDRVVKILVDDTRIDYDEGEIRFPFLPYTIDVILNPVFLRDPDFPFPNTLSNTRLSHIRLSHYCKNTYGLTEDESDFVWKEYKDSIRDKIKNNER